MDMHLEGEFLLLRRPESDLIVDMTAPQHFWRRVICTTTVATTTTTTNATV
jgi:hypothetical protein